MSTNAPQPPALQRPGPLFSVEGATLPAPPPKRPETVRIVTDNTEALTNALSRIKALEKENDTLQEALSHWQGVVRVAREKDSTLPDPEAVPC